MLYDTQYSSVNEDRLEKLRMELRRGVLVLAVLASLDQPQYGYSLRKCLQQSGIDIDEGTLYPLIRRLETQGLLVSEWRNEEGREKRYYRLSPEGTELLSLLSRDWRTTVQALDRLLENAP